MIKNFLHDTCNLTGKTIILSAAIHLFVLCLLSVQIRVRSEPKIPSFVFLGSILSRYDVQVKDTDSLLSGLDKIPAATTHTMIDSQASDLVDISSDLKPTFLQKQEKHKRPFKKRMAPATSISPKVQEESSEFAIPPRQPLQLDKP